MSHTQAAQRMPARVNDTSSAPSLRVRTKRSRMTGKSYVAHAASASVRTSPSMGRAKAIGPS